MEVRLPKIRARKECLGQYWSKRAEPSLTLTGFFDKWFCFKMLCPPASRKFVPDFLYRSIYVPNRFPLPGKAYRYQLPILWCKSFRFSCLWTCPLFSPWHRPLPWLPGRLLRFEAKNQSTISGSIRIALFSGSSRSSLMILRQWGHCINSLVCRPSMFSLNLFSQYGHKASKSNIGFLFFKI